MATPSAAIHAPPVSIAGAKRLKAVAASIIPAAIPNSSSRNRWEIFLTSSKEPVMLPHR